jgi:hypothetical protein
MSAQQQPDQQESIYYFGYGPMIHPTVRYRRGVQVLDEQPAILRNHRLTFAFGGVASVVQQRGYEVHGVVMRCQSQSDWEKIKGSEIGYYPKQVSVHPYADTPSELPVFSGSPEEDEAEETPPIKAFVLIQTEVDESKLDLPPERLPQERYLRLIAKGMAKYHCDEDYVNDQIVGVPFEPSRRPSNYLVFPTLQMNCTSESTYERSQNLPVITFEGYERLCAEGRSRSDDGKSPKHLYFILGNHVILTHNPCKDHPGFLWLVANAFGKKDVTFYLHMTHLDPDIPFCGNKDDINPAIHCSWAENLLVGSIASGLSAFRVFKLNDAVNENDLEGQSHVATERLKAFLRSTVPSTISSNSASKQKKRSSVARLTARIKKDLKNIRRSTILKDA